VSIDLETPDHVRLLLVDMLAQPPNADPMPIPLVPVLISPFTNMHRLTTNSLKYILFLIPET
jgi:hypothetical protein